MKKNIIFKGILSTIIVILVAVISLSVAGVFQINRSGYEQVSAESTSVESGAVFRNIETTKVFYFKSERSVTDVSSFVEVKANGKTVGIRLYPNRDEDGNPGFTKANGTWEAGVAYSVKILSQDFKIVGYEDYSSFIFIVDAPDALECEITDGAYYLKGKDFELTEIDPDDSNQHWNLIVNDVDPEILTSSVFIYEDGLDISKINEDGTLHSYALIIDANTTPVYNHETRQYNATLVNANVEDVFEELNIHQTIVPTEETFKFNEDETIKSIINSELFLSTVAYLYDETLGTKSFNLGEYCNFVIDYNFSTEPEVNVTVDLSLVFSGFLKSAKNASVTIKIANVLTPKFHGNFQKDPLAFDASLDLVVDSTIAVSGGFAYNFNNTDPNNNTEANTKLKNIVNNVASIVSDALNTEKSNEKAFIFATWVIPIGTTPIQVVESIGIEVKADVKAQLTADFHNRFEAEIGIVYCNNNISPISNVKDDFRVGSITLCGVVGAKVGLYNELGITACGIISVNVNLSVGVYCDVGGRLEMSEWNILNKSLNLDPAYYIETGIYLDLGVNGKVLIFNIKDVTLLSKKWPLWSSGYRFIPQEDESLNEVEEYYLASNYFFFTTFSTKSIDVLNPTATSFINKEIAWDEFNYEYDTSLLKLEGNKVKVSQQAPGAFETIIKVTSKVNSAWVKQIKVIKTPEGPTVTNFEKNYEKGSNQSVKFVVRKNASKVIGVSSESLDNLKYEYEDDVLEISAESLEKLAYGRNAFIFETSKGSVSLYVNVSSSRSVVPETHQIGEYSFNKSTPAPLVVYLDTLGHEITEISNLESSQWSYSAEKKQLRITANVFFELPSAIYSYKIDFSNGEYGMLNVKVTDTRLPIMKCSSYEYLIGSYSDLKLEFETYDCTVEKLYLNGKNYTAYLVDDLAISSDYFEGLNSEAPIDGRIVISGVSYKFTVNVYKSDALIIPTKYAEFDIANPKDVSLLAFAPDGVRLGCIDEDTSANLSASAFSYADDSITFSADYLKTLSPVVHHFKVIGAPNNVIIVIKVINTTVPHFLEDIEEIVIYRDQPGSSLIKWDMGDYTLDSCIIEGLSQDMYILSKNGITLLSDKIPYGENYLRIVTPVNVLTLKVTIKGEPKFLSASYIFTPSNGEELALKLDFAGKSIEEVHLFNDVPQEIDIFATDFRINESGIVFSNTFSYNLEPGKYYVYVNFTDGTTIKRSAEILVKEPLKNYYEVAESDGTEEHPYEIFTKEQFLSFAKDTEKNSFDGIYFRLMSDVNLSGATMNPIGSKKTPFKGVFDGNGYTILNVAISDIDKEYTGFVSYNEGTIKDLRLSNISISINKAGSVGIGLVVGNNKGNISRVEIVNGKINAISKSWLDLQSAYFDIGGLVGYNDGGNILKCKVEVSIEAEAKGLSVFGLDIGGRKSCINVGALIGYFKSGNMKRCEATATINAKAQNNNINSNDWYGNTELTEEELAESVRRCKVTLK